MKQRTAHGADAWLWPCLAALTVNAVLRARTRSILGIAVSAAGVVLLLTAMAMEPIAQVREERTAVRTPIVREAVPESDGALLYRETSSYYRGEPIAGQQVGVIGQSSLRPAGVARIPGPGELVVSPRMAELMSDARTTLSRRYPGQVVGLVTPDGLVGPDELVVWAGVPVSQFGPRPPTVVAFSARGQDGTALPAELRPAQALLVTGFVIPLVGLLIVAATVGGAQREQRLATLRLVGLSNRHVAAAAGAEAWVMAVLGVVAGTAMFGALKPFLAQHAPVTGGVWPSDVPLGGAGVGVLLAVVPAAAAAASIAALRAVRVTPLGVTRRAADRRPSMWRLSPVVVGTVLLVAASLRLPPVQTVPVRGSVLVVAVALCAAGLLLGGAVLSYALAALLQRLALPVAADLATRRVTARAARTARAVSGLAALVFVSGVLVSFFPLLGDAAAPSLRGAAAAAGGSSFMVPLEPGRPPSLQALEQDGAVTGLGLVWHVPVLLADGQSSAVNVVDCRGMAAVLGNRDLCSGISQQGGGAAATGQPYDFVDRADGTQRPEPIGPPIPLKSRLVDMPGLAVLLEAGGVPDGTLIDVAELPSVADLDAFQSVLFLRHDGTTVERIRTEIALAAAGGQALSLDERFAIANRTSRAFQGLTAVAFAGAAAVAALSLLIGLVDQLREQRLSMASLWVCGVRVSTLRRSLALQMALASAPAIGVATMLSIAAAHVFLGLKDIPPPFPWTAVLGISALSFTVPVLAAVSAMPLIGTGMRSRASLT